MSEGAWQVSTCCLSGCCPGGLVGKELSDRLRASSCPWEPGPGSLPFQSLGPPTSHFQPALCYLFFFVIVREGLSIHNSTLSAACVVDFVPPGHPERKRFTKNRRRQKGPLHIYVSFYKDPQTLVLTIGVAGVMWLIKGILGTRKPARLWTCVCPSLSYLSERGLRRGACEVKAEPCHVPCILECEWKDLFAGVFFLCFFTFPFFIILQLVF